MKRLIIPVSFVLLCVGLALSAEVWLPPLLSFAGTNSDRIQGLVGSVQLVLWLGAGIAALFGYRRVRGVVISGKVKTAGGKFVGGDDKSTTKIVIATDEILRELQRGAPKVDLHRAAENYLRYLLDRHAYLSLKGMGVSDRVPLRLLLLDLYVPLRARLELPEGETWKRDPSAGSVHGLRLA